MSDGGVTEVGTMRGYVWTPERRRTVIGAVALIFVLAVSQSAYAAKPTQPVLRDAYPSGGNQVRLEWIASTDASATHTVSYELYRSRVPITQTAVPSLTPLAVGTDYTLTPPAVPGTTWTAVVNADTDEVRQSYVWYYAVRAKDDQATPVYSDVSATLAPNLHGYSMGNNIYSCQRCHNVHGAPTPPGIVDRSSWICYYCHGTDTTTSSGNDGTAAGDLGDRSTLHVKKDFYDYGNLPTGGSQHRGDLMTDTNQCKACHSPHRSPYLYDLAGAYVEASSYRKMLRVQTGYDVATSKPTYTNGYYSVNSNSAESTAFCFSCHGSTTQSPEDGSAETNMGYVSTSGYANTAGDHNEAGYAIAAHGISGPTSVKSNDFTKTGAYPAGQFPQVQCLACHDKHASAAGKLIAYRGDDTKADGVSTYAQAELCYKCHSAAGAAAELAAGTSVGDTNLAWNKRDVQAQFGKVSRHPTTAGGGQWVLKSGTSFSQTEQAEFATGTLFQTTAAAVPGSVVLSQFDQSSPIPPELYLFSQRAGSLVVDAYQYATGTSGTWNTPYAPANETSFNTATGSSLFNLGGDIYRTRGGNVTTLPMIRKFTLGTDNNGSWGNTAMTTAFNSGFNTGSAVADNASSSVVYISQGGGTNVINWWQYSGATENNMTFSGGNIGIGSGIAYTPDADRLWVILRTDATGAGTLWHRGTPGIRTGAQTFTDTGVVAGPSGGTSYYGRMAYFEGSAGTDYLASMGRDGTARFFHVMSNLAGTPTRLRMTGNTKEPSGGGAYADGCSLVWDGVPGGYLYAQTTASTRLMRIKIPDDPTVDGGANGWGTWEAVTNLPANMGAGSDLAFAMVDRPGSVVMPNYYASGTITTGDINPVTDSVAWGSVSFTESEPADTALTVTVQGWNGSTWSDLATSDTSPIDVSSYPIATYTKLRLRANLSTTAPLSATPRLDDWAVTSMTQVWQTSGSVTCANCHNVHSVGAGGTEVWDMARVSDPDNTKLAFTGTPTQFCLRCHDGAAPTAVTNETSLVPYSVGFSEFDAATAPLFPGWNKQAAGADWASSGHANSRVNRMTPGCESCHDPHGSNNPRLLAGTAYYVGTSPPGSHVTLRRNDASTYAEEGLCYVCHTSQRATPNCTGGACHPNIDTVTGLGMNVQTAFTGTYRHPVELTGKHTDTEGPAELGQANRHAECADCHDPHATRGGKSTLGSSKAGNVLVGATGIKIDTWPANWTAVSVDQWQPLRLTGQTTDHEAYLCLKCHSSYSGQPFQVTSGSGTYTSTDVALEFNPSNFSSHNVFGQSVAMKTAFTVGANNYTWTKPADSAFLVTGLTSNSMLTCTSCHSNTTAAAKGPHGSTVRWLLDPNYATDWKTVYLSNTASGMNNTTNICAKCHTGLASANNVHSRGNHQGSLARGGCTQCHVKIPHGWKRPRLIGYATDPAQYATDSNGLRGIILKSYTPSGWSQSNDCVTGSCYGGHNASGTIWP